MRKPQRRRPHAINPRNKRTQPPAPVAVPDNMCKLVTDVLNKSKKSEEFKTLLAAVGDPSRQFEVGPARFYDFHQCGLDLTYHVEHDKFWMATFEYDTAGVRSGEVHKYNGDLPGGIEWSDSCAVVDQKLGIKAYDEGWVSGCTSTSCDIKSRNADYWKHYQLAKYEMTLIFESDEGGLGMVSLCV